MSSMLVTAGDALVVLLQAVSVPADWTVQVERKWVPIIDRDEMPLNTVFVTVVPLKPDASQATRGPKRWNLDFDVAIQVAVPDDTNASIDPVAAIAESYIASFVPGLLGSTGYQLMPPGPKIDRAFPVQSFINQHRVYTGIIAVTYTNWS